MGTSAVECKEVKINKNVCWSLSYLVNMASSINDQIPDDDDFLSDFEGNDNVAGGDDVSITPPPKSMPNEPTPKSGITFSDRTLERLLQHAGNKLKLSQDASKLFTELMRIHVAEAISRAGEQAIKEESSQITLEHIEKVLPQFLLDFN